MSLLRAVNTEPTYENFNAQCPHCSFNNIFNRVSDLKRLNFITYLEVNCFDCSNEFYINGDIAADKYEYLLYDAELLIQQKHYMYCILNATQALEAFFGLYLRILFIEQPLKQHVFRSLMEGNTLGTLLHSTIGHKTYFALRNIFIHSVLAKYDFQSVGEIREELDVLENIMKESRTTSNKEILKYPDAETRELLLDLKRFKIHEIRNNVVHRAAYRPTLAEALDCLREARRLVFKLRAELKFKKNAIPSLFPS